MLVIMDEGFTSKILQFANLYIFFYHHTKKFTYETTIPISVNELPGSL